MTFYKGFQLFVGGSITTNEDGTFTIRGNTDVENAIFSGWIDDFLATSAGGVLFPHIQSLGTIAVRAIPVNSEFPDYTGMAINDAAYKSGGAMGMQSIIDEGSGGGSRFDRAGVLYDASSEGDPSPDILSINMKLGRNYQTIAGTPEPLPDSQVIFLHELMHAVNQSFITSGAYSPGLDIVGTTSAYEEQIAIFYANYMAQSLGINLGERVGHSSSGTGPSKSAISYLLGATATSYNFVNGNLEAGFRTTDGGSIVKTYVVGNGPGAGGGVEASFGADVVEIRYSASSLNEQKINDILEQSAVEDSDPLQFLKNQIAEQNARGERSWVLAPQQLLVASGERIVSPEIDIEGPRPDPANGNFIHLDAGSDSQLRTIIFGAAGWTGIADNSAKAASEFGALDKLTGGSGNDWIVSFSDRDGNELDGGRGDDFIVGSNMNDILRGDDGLFSSGNDALIGRDGDDELNGGGGDDELTGGDGADKLYGGLGDDTLFGDEDDSELDGGLGHDKVDYRDSNVAIDWAAANAKIEGIEEIIGSDFDDVLVMPTSITGQLLASDLVIDGGKGDDTIQGTELTNELRGGEGDDTILGLGGADIIDGGDGDDLLVGGEDSYLLWPDDDELRGGAGDDRLSGGDGDDKLYGGADNDGLLGGKGKDLLHGDEGDDLLAGGTGDDDLYGDAGDDGIVGDEGSDRLFGGTGNDILVGGQGEDILNGESGDDILDAAQDDSDADVLKGEEGRDWFLVNNGDTILDPEQGDRVILAGQLLKGGEKKEPPRDPCNPEPAGPAEEDGQYKGRDGTTYELAGSTLMASFGGETVLLQNFRNGDAGISLRPARPDQKQAECQRDPLILDLDGDREVVRELFDSTAYFDLDNDGFAERVAWTNSGDGFLALDRDGNGKIESGAELFGSGRTEPARGTTTPSGTEGFAELAILDTNRDNQITAADLQFHELRVWIDANGDGISEAGELKTLSELGLVSISLNAVQSDNIDCGCDGTTVSFMSSVTKADGSVLGIYDAFLSIDQYDSIELNPVEVPADFEALPFLIGSGSVSDLDVAMARDPALEAMVREFASLDVSQAGEISQRVQQIILRWTGADEVPTDGRGPNIDARMLAAIEKFSGSDFHQAAVGANPRSDAAAILMGEWQEITRRVTAQLLGQTELGQTLMPGLSFAGAAFYQVAEGTSLGSLLQILAQNAPSGGTARLTYWHATIGSLAEYAHQFSMSEDEFFAAVDAAGILNAMSLSARDVTNLKLEPGGHGGVVGTARDSRVAFSGADLLMASRDGETLKGSSGDDRYIVVRETNDVVLKDSSGTDRLLLLDQKRSEIQVTAVAADEGADGVAGLKLLLTLSNQAGDWSLELEAELIDGRFRTSIETIDFEDEKGVAITSLLSPVIAKPDGFGSIYFGAGDSPHLAGGAGDDWIVGNSRSDHYRFGIGSGSDIFADTAEPLSTGDILHIDDLPANVVFVVGGAAGTDLIVRTSAGDTATISRQWIAGAAIETFIFADGTQLSAEEVRSMLTTGSAADDVIMGTSANDIIDGRGGNDAVAGRGGNDTYLFGRGYGVLSIDDPLGLNQISFAEINSAEVALSRSDGKTILTIADTGDMVVIEGQSVSGRYSFQFADRLVTLDEILLEQASRAFVPTDGVVLGTVHDDGTVYGTDGNDVINGLSGEEWIDGGLGDDTYVYTGGIKEIFEDGGFDIIRPSAQFTFESLILFREGLTFDGSDGEILLSNQVNDDGTATSYNTHRFVEGLIFADGRTVNLAAGRIVSGGDGADILFNFGSQDAVFTPGKGNDRIFVSGAAGTKTVRLEADFGHDVFYPGAIFHIDLTAFTLDDTVGFARRGDDLIISTAGGANSITVKVAFDPFNAYIESSILFAGGLTLDLAAAGQRISVATAGADILFGRSVLDGGAGDDSLIGSDSLNEYHFERGYGNDVIKERGSGGPTEHSAQDRLILHGLNPGDVTFERHPDDKKSILMTIKNSGETLVLDGTPFDDFRYLKNSHNALVNGPDRYGAHWIERIVFADGTVLSQRDLEQRILDGERTAGSDTLINFGAPREDANIAGAYLDGGAGDDLYVNDFRSVFVRFSAGGGSDTVFNTSNSSTITTVQLVGIADADVVVRSEVREGLLYTVLYAKDGSSLAVEGNATSSLTLKIVGQGGQVYSPFQDGPLVGTATGTAGDDYLKGLLAGPLTTGFSRPDPINDVFTPGAGNDVIAGYSGNDIVRFGRGDGTDTLLDSRAMGSSRNKVQTYTIEFAADVLRSDVEIGWTDDGTGLIRISIKGTDDALLMEAKNFGALKFTDGTIVQTVSTGNGAEIVNLASLRAVATSSDDVLLALPNETIAGGAGDDTIQYVGSPNSSARIIFGPGSGNDHFSNSTQPTIVSDRYRAAVNTRHELVLSDIVSLDQVRFLREATNPDDLVVEIVSTGERLTVDGHFKLSRNGDRQWTIYTVTLATGESFWWDEVHGRLNEAGLSGSNEISSGAGGGVLDGMAGNDVLRGGIGDDRYILGRDYDEDVVQDAGGQDSLLFEEGILASDVFFSRTGSDGNDLLIEVMGQDRLSMTINNQFSLASSRVESFQFADGEMLSWADVQAFILDTQSRSLDDTITGFTSDDVIAGLSGSDVLTGGRGDDVIDGGEGRDVAQFSGTRSEYIITTQDGVTTVRDTVAGRDGSDLLTSVEDVKFLGDGELVQLVPGNNAPTAAASEGVTTEDADLLISRSALMALAGDADGDLLSLSVGNGVHGKAWIDGQGNIRFRPDADFNGEAGFDYTVRDANGGSATAHFRVDVAGVNDAPTPVTDLDAISSDEDGFISIALPETMFADPDGDLLSLELRLANGDPLPSWLRFENGLVTGQPPADFNGVLSLAVFASDGQYSVPAAFTLTIRPRNDAPVYVGPSLDRTVQAADEVAIAIGSDLFNDVDGDTLTVQVMQASGEPLPAWLTYSTGQLTGQVPDGFDGSLQLVIRASDGRRLADAYFSLSAPLNQAPVVAVPLQDVAIAEDGLVDLTLPAGAFTDPDGDQLTYGAALADGSPLPDWLLLEGTRLHGEPPANFNGEFDIVVTASDGVASVTDSFTLTVTPVNDAPQVNGALLAISADEGAVIASPIDLGLFGDVDGDALSFSAMLSDGSALPAWLSFVDGSLSGVVPNDAAGTYELRIVASDGVAQVEAPFSLVVNAVNDAPVAADDALFITERGHQLHIAAADLLANDYDADGDPLHIVSVGPGIHGTASLGVDGTVIYTPDGAFTGSDSFTYTLSDGQTVGTASVSVRIDDPFEGWSQGTSASEKLFGNLNAPNRIAGLGGDDHLKGGHLQDRLAGGTGDDKLNGLNEDDHLWGMEGNDILEGSSGIDTAYYYGYRSSYVLNTHNGAVTITDTLASVDGDDGTDLLNGIERLSFKGGETLSISSPIILDLNGDGVRTVSAANSDARFDMDGDGLADDTSWISAGDGFLFLDRDGNGTLSNVGEMSFIGDVPGATTDLAGLRAFDSNGDGALSAQDSRFSDFRVWRDSDSDGAVDTGEVLSLSTIGLRSISLTGTANNSTVQAGEVAIVNNGSWTRTDGSTRTFGDAAMTFFSTAASPLAPLANMPSAYSRKRGAYELVASGGMLTMSLREAKGAIDPRSGAIGVLGTFSFKGSRAGMLSPVVLDLDGDGIELVRTSKSRARFDMDGNGTADRTGWLGRDDGFLVIDRNLDGKITSNVELTFGGEDPAVRSSLDGLSALDSNGDGTLDASDARFAELRIWRDRNSNGHTDQGELVTLADAQIKSINLSALASEATGKVGTNLVRATATFERGDGTRGTVGDVALAFEPQRHLGATELLREHADDYRLDAGRWSALAPIEDMPIFDPPRPAPGAVTETTPPGGTFVGPSVEREGPAQLRSPLPQDAESGLPALIHALRQGLAGGLSRGIAINPLLFSDGIDPFKLYAPEAGSEHARASSDNAVISREMRSHDLASDLSSLGWHRVENSTDLAASAASGSSNNGAAGVAATDRDVLRVALITQDLAAFGATRGEGMLDRRERHSGPPLDYFAA